MIPVDLNRLREAQSGRMAIPERNTVRRDAVDAVLDAPTVWWCMEHDMPELDYERDHVACPHGQRSRYVGWDCDMRPGKWVPVVGGQE